jgi:signal transduction histidine kinase
VVLEQPVSQALGAVSNLGWYTLVWTGVCLLLAVGGGILLSRGVTRPVRKLARAARTIEQGDYQLEVEVSSDDELGQLARGFNDMAAAIQAHRDELEQLNADLQRRVEERTREVHDALEQVIRSQKLGALGELSAGIAHELNNPLTGILGMSQLVQGGLEQDDERREYLQDVIDQARRMRDIVEKMRRFSESPEGMEYEPLDVNELCREALELAGGSIERAKIELELQLSSAVPKVKVNQPELQQALVHLIYNAVGAMSGSDGGKLVVKTSEVEGAVAISVKDSGVGIPQEARSKIFEPFYSPSKTATRRAGLGLSVVDRIVREHEGQIRVQSTEGEGSEFTIYLPGVREELHLR